MSSSMSGASVWKGPPIPSGTRGTALEKQLQNEGAQAKRGIDLVHHIITKGTPGKITQVKWNKEYSTLQHEYLLLCVVTDDSSSERRSHASWIRVERMRRVKGEESAALCLNIAPSAKTLVNSLDETVCTITVDQNTPTLVDAAKLMSIMQEEAAQYSFLVYNCWWFARQMFQILCECFMPDGKAKRKILWDCGFANLRQAEATYHSPWRTQTARSFLFAITIPVFHIAWPTIIGLTLVTSSSILLVLRSKRKKVMARFKDHLEKSRNPTDEVSS